MISDQWAPLNIKCAWGSQYRSLCATTERELRYRIWLRRHSWTSDHFSRQNAWSQSKWSLHTASNSSTLRFQMLRRSSTISFSRSMNAILATLPVSIPDLMIHTRTRSLLMQEPSLTLSKSVSRLSCLTTTRQLLGLRVQVVMIWSVLSKFPWKVLLLVAHSTRNTLCWAVNNLQVL